MPSTVLRSTLRPIAVAILLATAFVGQAQLIVSPQTDLQQLAASITGPGVQISNPQITCHNQGYGEFTFTGNQLGPEEGVILTTGRINDAPGPNNNTGSSNWFAQNTSGDATLDIVTGRSTRDACKFEFDIIPSGDSLSFDFVFASEEYNEWVGSQYNDVFGFFISGPGIAGDPGIGNNHNIARIPVSNQPVTINNVNNGSNATYYVDNTGGPQLQYDGFTKNLTARSAVTPCSTYHLKLVVADATDRKFDSGVFIAKVKSNNVTISAFTANSSGVMVEGCNPGWFRFSRPYALPAPLTIQYFLQGTAVNGTDYAAISPIAPNLPKSITIPANQSYVDRAIDPVLDGLSESNEHITVILGNPNCPAQNLDTLQITIADSLLASVSPGNTAICQADSVQYQVIGGQQYAWSPSTGVSGVTSADPWLHPTTTTNYTVTISEGACNRTMTRLVRVSALTLNGTITAPLCNGLSNGAIDLLLSHGVPPYAFTWTGPNGFTSNTEDIGNLSAGTYTVTVTDAACTRTRSFNVIAPAPLAASLAPAILPFGQNIACNGTSTGSITSTIIGGTGPYSPAWSGPNGFSSTSANINGLSAGTYALTVTDLNGCNASATTTLTQPAPMAATIGGTSPVLCFGANIGSASVNVIGGIPPYAYAWGTVPAQSTSTATGLAAGSYPITVTDGYGCIATTTANISGPSAGLSTTIASGTNVSCFGNSTGAATISIGGGTAPYATVWNTVPAQNGTSATALPAGTWTATVTDANGCSTTRNVNITQPAAGLTASVFAQTGVNCFGDSNGSATISVNGGTGPYTYQWNTSPAQNTATASNLSAGSYSCTVQDVNSCSTVVNVTISAPASALSATATSVTDVLIFGQATGEATIGINGGTAPYQIAWSTVPTQTGNTASALGAGSYTASVTDASGCMTDLVVTIAQPGSALTVAITAQSDPACPGDLTGSATAQGIGGVAPYSYAWSTVPPQLTSTATGLGTGTWSVTATDANGASSTTSVSIGGPTAPLQLTLVQSLDQTCFGSANGQATVLASGGTGPYAYTWNTNPAQTNATAAGLNSGIYQAMVTDANGCTAMLPVAINGPSAPLTVVVTNITDVLCHADTSGTVTVNATGGTAPYNYSWSTSPATMGNTLINVQAGTYTVVVTDANGCTTAGNATITQPNQDIYAYVESFQHVSCFGANDGWMTVQVGGGSGSYTVWWNTTPPQAGNTATGLGVGLHEFVIQDNNGCASTKSYLYQINGPNAPLGITTVVSDHDGYAISCPGGSDGSIDATVSGGTAPYTLSWTSSTGAAYSTEDISDLEEGVHTLTVTDANGCNTSTTLLLEAPAPITITAAITSAACQGSGTGTIDATITGGTAPYTVAWSGPNGFSATQQDLSALSAGVYTIVATDAHGCTATAYFDVSEPGLITISGIVGTYNGGWSVSCAGASDGSIDATIVGGVAPYSHTWSGPTGATVTTEDLSGLGAGSYALTVQDVNGCAALALFELTEPMPLAAQLGNTSYNGFAVSCAGAADGAIDATITGGTASWSFSWSGPDAFSSNSEDISGLVAGTYDLVVTDHNGCTANASTTLNTPDPLSGHATSPTFNSGSNVSCSGLSNGTIALAIGGGTGLITTVWSGPNGYTSNDPTPTGLAAGTYTALLTDANGCMTTSTIALTEPTPTTLTASSSVHTGGTAVSCATANDGSIDLAVTGGAGNVTYQWSGPNAFTASTEDISALIAGDYTVTTNDANGCTAGLTITLMAPAALTTAQNITLASCSGSNTAAIDLTIAGGTAPYDILWAGPGAYSSTDQDISALFAGVYVASISDANGCTLSQSFSVTEAGTLQANATLSSHGGGYQVSCAGSSDGSILVAASGGTAPYYYQWIGPDGYSATVPYIQGLQAGTYELILNDQNGCSTLLTYTLTGPDELAAGLVGQVFPGGANTSCSDSPNGSIDALVVGGVQPYQYAWTNGAGFTASSEDLTGLEPSTYVLTVVDALGCTVTDSITLTAPAPIVALATSGQFPNGANVSCNGATDGSIDLGINGGVQPYTVQWTGPSGNVFFQEDPTGLDEGTYDAVITDLNGCTATTSITLNAPSPLAITLNASLYGNGFNLPCHGSTNGSVNASVSGGSANHTYAWSGPNGYTSSTPDLTGVGAGTYVLVVTDDAGCSASALITLTQPTELDMTATLSDAGYGYAVSCSANDGSIDINVSGGSGPYVFDWTGDNGFASLDQDLTSLNGGTYLLNLIDANGCAMTQSFVLNSPSALQAGMLVTGTICDNATDGTIDLSVNGGVGPFTYAWSGTNGFTSASEDLSALPGGSYTVLITDAMNCSTAATGTVLASPGIALNAYVPTLGSVNIPCAGDSSGVIELTLTGGAGPLSIQWTGPNGFQSTSAQLSGLVAGTYQALVTDVNGCSTDTSITLSEPNVPLLATLSATTFASGTNISCNGNADGSIDVAVLGGSGPYVFDWRGPDSTTFSTEDLTGLVAGTYDLVVTDANQCTYSTSVVLTEPDSALAIDVTLSSYIGGYSTSCASSSDGAIDVTVSGGSSSYSYGWSGPNGFVSSTADIIGVSGGTYAVTITDLNGCTLVQAIDVTAPPALGTVLAPVLFPGGTAISCNGSQDGAVTSTITGGAPGYSTQWTGPNGFSASTTDISQLDEGTYCVTVTDTNGCVAQSCIDIVAPAAMVLTTTTTDATCGNSNGHVDLTVSGGTGPFAYAWNAGPASEDLIGVPAASYSVHVTDANGCMATIATVLNGSAALLASGATTDNTCADATDGAIELTLLSGLQPYSFAWSNGATSEDLTGLPAGQYAVVVTEATGCTWSGTFDILAPLPIIADGQVLEFANGFNVTAPGASDGQVTLAVSGGTAPYTYAWSHGATTPSVNGLSAGTYTVTITDANGCATTYSVELEEPSELAMPTGFSPNGDGANDTFIVKGLDAHPNNQFVVFNRWGNVVYDRLNYRNDWRGENSQGEQLPDGTYFIILTVNEGAKTMQNYVDLRR